MQKTTFIKIATSIAIGTFLTSVNAANNSNALVDTLFDKDILSAGEAARLTTTKSNVPNLKGDLRLRYQIEQKPGEISRNRARLRFRLGTKASISDDITVQAGIATGSEDPRSTNQTLENGFTTKGLHLNYAYLNYMVQKGLTISAGKMKNPLWRTSDLMWDGDITPEGFSINYKTKELFATLGHFNIDMIKGSRLDPVLVAIQTGLQQSFGKSISAKLSGQLYQVQNMVLKERLDNSAGTNSLFEKDPMIVGASASITQKKLFGLPQISLFADLLYNTVQSSDNKVYLTGVSFGHKKVRAHGQWKAKALYRYLQQDATLDILPDSDSFGGATGIKGLELIATYGLNKNTSISIDYYLTETISDKTTQYLIQADLNVKF